MCWELNYILNQLIKFPVWNQDVMLCYIVMEDMYSFLIIYVLWDNFPRSCQIPVNFIQEMTVRRTVFLFLWTYGEGHLSVSNLWYFLLRDKSSWNITNMMWTPSLGFLSFLSEFHTYIIQVCRLTGWWHFQHSERKIHEWIDPLVPGRSECN